MRCCLVCLCPCLVSRAVCCFSRAGPVGTCAPLPLLRSLLAPQCPGDVIAPRAGPQSHRVWPPLAPSPVAPLTRSRCLGNPSHPSEHAFVRGRFSHRALSDIFRNLSRLETLTSFEFPRHVHSVSSSAGHLVTAGHKQSPLTDRLALDGLLPPTVAFRAQSPFASEEV